MRVGQTLGANLLGTSVIYTEPMMLSVLLATISWVFIATLANVPISITHSVVGSMIGLGLIWALWNGHSYAESMNWYEVGLILLGLVISPILGFIGASIGQYFIIHYFKAYNTGITQIEQKEKFFRYAILGFAFLNEISRAGNDSGKAIGIVFGLLNSSQINSSSLIWIISLIGIMFALGLAFVGKNLIVNVGNTTGGQIRPSEAFVIEMVVAIILFTSTIFGLPVSGSHILIFALIGSAQMKGEKPDPKYFRQILKSWILTFPITASLCCGFYIIIQII
jgi:PiT family inorganic phosphate transporter